jgi:hypothetical protein
LAFLDSQLYKSLPGIALALDEGLASTVPSTPLMSSLEKDFHGGLMSPRRVRPDTEVDLSKTRPSNITIARVDAKSNGLPFDKAKKINWE